MDEASENEILQKSKVRRTIAELKLEIRNKQLELQKWERVLEEMQRRRRRRQRQKLLQSKEVQQTSETQGTSTHYRSSNSNEEGKEEKKRNELNSLRPCATRATDRREQARAVGKTHKENVHDGAERVRKRRKAVNEAEEMEVDIISSPELFQLEGLKRNAVQGAQNMDCFHPSSGSETESLPDFSPFSSSPTVAICPPKPMDEFSQSTVPVTTTTTTIQQQPNAEESTSSAFFLRPSKPSPSCAIKESDEVLYSDDYGTMELSPVIGRTMKKAHKANTTSPSDRKLGCRADGVAAAVPNESKPIQFLRSRRRGEMDSDEPVEFIHCVDLRRRPENLTEASSWLLFVCQRNRISVWSRTSADSTRRWTFLREFPTGLKNDNWWIGEAFRSGKTGNVGFLVFQEDDVDNRIMIKARVCYRPTVGFIEEDETLLCVVDTMKRPTRIPLICKVSDDGFVVATVDDVLHITRLERLECGGDEKGSGINGAVDDGLTSLVPLRNGGGNLLLGCSPSRLYILSLSTSRCQILRRIEMRSWFFHIKGCVFAELQSNLLFLGVVLKNKNKKRKKKKASDDTSAQLNLIALNPRTEKWKLVKRYQEKRTTSLKSDPKVTMYCCGGHVLVMTSTIELDQNEDGRSFSRFLEIWDVVSGDPIASLEMPSLTAVNHVVIDGCQSVLLIGDRQGNVTVYPLSSPTILNHFSTGNSWYSL